MYATTLILFKQRNAARLAAFFYSINGFIIELVGGRTATDHPDVINLVCIQLAIYFALLLTTTSKRRYAVFTGLFLGCALLSKWLPCLIVLPILYFFQKHQHHHCNKQSIIQFVIMITIAGLIFLPWQFYIHHNFPLEAKWEQDYNTLHFWKSLEGHDAPWYYYLNHMGIHFNELVYIPLIWFIMQLFKKRFSYNYVALLIWVIVPILFFSASATKMPGYILMCAPPLFMITAIFIVEMYQRLPKLNLYKKQFFKLYYFF
jgi:4-amino-4-deoxy-L-arabinose transferase-like glycosyltransferase